MPTPWAGRRRAGPSRLTFGRVVSPRLESRRDEIEEFGVRNEEVRAYAERLKNEPDGLSLEERVASRFWYHTIELPGGVTTAGMFDHRALVPHYGIPEDLTGRRVLDIGAWDGFWSFEFEKRGAEVVALDLEAMGDTDLPAGQREVLDRSGFNHRLGDGFELAREALGSRVTKVTGSIYDLDPKTLGTFDLVHVGDVSLHLESPTAAFRQVRRVTKGQAMIVVTYDPKLKGEVVEYLGGWTNATWWIPSFDASVQMVVDAGFSNIKIHKTYRLDTRDGGKGHWRAICFAEPSSEGQHVERMHKPRRFITRKRVRGMGRVAAVAAVAVAAFAGIRIIDSESGQPGASPPAQRSTSVDASLLSVGIETAPAATEPERSVERAADVAQVDERAAAITIDRKLVESGREQIYGTQHECREGELVPTTPVQDPQSVDELRTDVGFPPLDQSVAAVSQEDEPC